DHWAVDPRSTITNAVTEDLQSRGVFRSVHLFDSRTTSDYLITGSIDHLEEVDQDHSVFVNVGVSAQLLDVKSRAVLWQDVSSQTSKLDKRSVLGLVAGMSQAMDQVIAQLLSSMQTRLVQLQSSALSDTKEPESE
ncbi:MAG: membrane integrity-associated transporter subunit PqiC, partial [Acidobacteriaceae bacterium]|nr:membrane integrity-associated transporter subunit PqiC [Acidobacteriaceae bacterium]